MDQLLYTYTATIIECAQALLGESDGPLSDKQYEVTKKIIANAERFVHIFAEFQSLPLNTLGTTRSLRHEFGTPLTPITGYSELLMMGVWGSMNERQMEHIQCICETTNQLRLAVEMIVNEARRHTAQAG